MKVADKGTRTLNILFGVFIVLNITNTVILLFDRLNGKKPEKLACRKDTGRDA